MTLRRIHVALTHLPMGVWPEPHHAASWSTTDYLLANVIDAVRELTWVTVQSQTKRRVERPKPCYRPNGRPPAMAGGDDKPKVRWSDLPALLGGPALGAPPASRAD